MNTEADVFIDDIKLQDIGVIVKLESQEDMLPSTRDQVVSIPGMHGAYDFGAWIEPRSFILSCRFEERGYINLKERVRNFVMLFLDHFGKPKNVKLRFGDEPDKYYTVRYSGAIPLQRIAGFGLFSVPLTAYDPHAYTTTSNEDVFWGSEDITFLNTSYTYGHTGGGQSTSVTSPKNIPVYVSGLAIKPVVVINGTGTNVTLSANGKTCSLGTFTNTNWTIDLHEYIVIKNGVNGMNSFTGNWLEFLPGQNNIAVGGSNLSLTIQVKFEDKFM